jgi:hypothetical protein
MAINMGKDGYVNFSSKEMLHINNWELSVADDALETTAFGGGWDRTYVPGLRGVTATFSGYYEDTSTGHYTLISMLMNTGTPSTCDAQLLYYHPTTATFAGFAGGAVVTGLTLGEAVEGIQTISGNLQFDGGIHTTADAT